MLPAEAYPSGSSGYWESLPVSGTCSQWKRKEGGEHREKEGWKEWTAAGRMAVPAVPSAAEAAGERPAYQCEGAGREEIWLKQDDPSSRVWPSPLVWPSSPVWPFCLAQASSPKLVQQETTCPCVA